MEDLGVPSIYFKPPEYNCPVHGTVTKVMTVEIANKHTVYCMQCINDFLKKNLPVLEDKEVLG